MENSIDQDAIHMRRALELAGAWQGRTSPNPAVGAVVVKDGTVVGEGAHTGPGQPHAEVEALARAGEGARGATVYVTLEPCCHWGRTPPCTDALIAAGVRRVVAAMEDPNPLVASKGLATLRKTGITVSVGPMEAEARRMNEGFVKHVTTGLPFVTAKWAMTLDGRIATGTGDSKWITSAEARAHARTLRARHGAVMVGVGTILADDPGLGPPTDWGHPLVRIILDTDLRTPPDARVFHGCEGPVTVFCGEDACGVREARLTDSGARVVRLPGKGPHDLPRVLAALGGIGINAVWAEGGSKLLGSLFDQACVDRVHTYIAPRVLGDASGIPPVSGGPKAFMSQTVDFANMEMETIGTDVFVTGLVKRGATACSRD